MTQKNSRFQARVRNGAITATDFGEDEVDYSEFEKIGGRWYEVRRVNPDGSVEEFDTEHYRRLPPCGWGT